jgi:hypothetical protein
MANYQAWIGKWSIEIGVGNETLRPSAHQERNQLVDHPNTAANSPVEVRRSTSPGEIAEIEEVHGVHAAEERHDKPTKFFLLIFRLVQNESVRG